MSEEYVIGEEFAKEWNRIRSKVDGIGGDGVSNTPSAISHGQIDGTPEQLHHSDWQTIKITGLVSGGTGRYLGVCFFGATNNNPSNLAESDLGQTAGASTVEVWNIADIASGSSSLAVDSYVLAQHRGFNKITGNPIYECYSGGLPTPQYQWQEIGAISQNQLGAFFTPAVSMSMS